MKSFPTSQFWNSHFSLTCTFCTLVSKMRPQWSQQNQKMSNFCFSALERENLPIFLPDGGVSFHSLLRLSRADPLCQGERGRDRVREKERGVGERYDLWVITVVVSAFIFIEREKLWWEERLSFMKVLNVRGMHVGKSNASILARVCASMCA